MIQHHKWSLTELEDMMPYEREIYVTLLTNWVQEENERIKQQQNMVKTWQMQKLIDITDDIASRTRKNNIRTYHYSTFHTKMVMISLKVYLFSHQKMNRKT